MFGITFRDPFRGFFDTLNEVAPRYSYNVQEDGDSIVLSTDLPGVKEPDIEVGLENGILTVRAQRRDGTRSYFHSWSVPKGIDAENIKAEYEDGVLVLTLPRQEQAKRRLIPVAAKKELAETTTA